MDEETDNNEDNATNGDILDEETKLSDIRIAKINIPETNSIRLKLIKYICLHNNNIYNGSIYFQRQMYHIRKSYVKHIYDNLDDYDDLLSFNDRLDIIEYIMYNKNIETKDDKFRYLLHVTDHIPEGENAPVELVSDDIISIILNKRKMEFIQDLEQMVYDDGVNRNQFEIYQ